MSFKIDFIVWKQTTGARFKKQNNPEMRCWNAQISYKNKKRSLGMYEDPWTAEIVYNFVKHEIISSED